MDSSFLDKFILLALDAKKGKFLIDSLSLNYGIAGGVLLVLSDNNKLEIKEKRLFLSDKKLTGNKILDDVIRLIEKSKKNRKIKFWINKIGNRSSRYKKGILNELNKKGIVKINKKTFFFGLIHFYRYPVLNINFVSDLKNKLRSIILKNEKSNTEEILLISLMNSCKLLRVLFQNKKEYKIASKKVKELTKNIEISDAVGQALKEIQAAVLVATTSAFVGASSTH